MDKVKHFLIAGFVESVGFATLQAIGAGRSASVGTATVAAVAASVGREIHDRRTKGLFSVRDLVWDGLGITGALLIAGHTQR